MPNLTQLPNQVEIPTILKYNNLTGFSFSDTFVDLILNKKFTENYTQAPKTEVSDEGILNSPSFWKSFQKIAEPIGNTITENIFQYIDNISNIDTCHINALQSHWKTIGLSESDNDIYNIINNFPDDVLKLINIFSISPVHLINNDILSPEIIYQIFSSLDDDTLPLINSQNTNIPADDLLTSTVNDINNWLNNLKTAKTALQNIILQETEHQIVIDIKLRNTIAGINTLLNNINIIEKITPALISDKSSAWYTDTLNAHTQLLAAYKQIKTLYTDNTQFQINTEDPEQKERIDNFLLEVNSCLEKISLKLPACITSFNIVKYKKYLYSVFKSLIEHKIYQPYSKKLIENYNEEVDFFLHIKPERRDQYLQYQKLTGDSNKYLVENNYILNNLVSYTSRQLNGQYNGVSSDKEKNCPNINKLLSLQEYQIHKILSNYHNKYSTNSEYKSILEKIPVFKLVEISNNIDERKDSYDNYSNNTVQLLNEISTFKKSFARIFNPSTGIISILSEYDDCQYAYYKEKEVIKYFELITTNLLALNLTSLSIGNKIFSYNTNNSVITNVFLTNQNLDEDSAEVEVVNTKFPNINLLIERCANILVDMCLDIITVREYLKSQVQRHYSVGTSLLLTFVINNFLTEFTDGLKELFTNFNTGALADDDNHILTKKLTSSVIEYIDATEYYNIKTNTSNKANFSYNVNNRYWEATNTKTNKVADINNEFSIFVNSLTSDFYNTLITNNSPTAQEKITFEGNGSLSDFLVKLYQLGAQSSYVSTPTEKYPAGQIYLPISDNISTRRKLTVSENLDLAKQQAEIVLRYSGQNVAYKPYLNIKNKAHPSIQIHPYLNNIIEYHKIIPIIEEYFYSFANYQIELDIAAEKLSEYFGSYGNTLDIWKNNNLDFSGYFSRYEHTKHDLYNKLGDVSPLTGFEGAFFPDAVEDLYFAINNNALNQVVDSIKNGQTSIIINNKTYPTFYGKYYSHLSLTSLELQRIAKQVEEYAGLIVNEICTTTSREDNTPKYDIYKYGLDYNLNSIFIYKTYKFADNCSDEVKAATGGELWIRFSNHPLAFPAINLNDINDETNNNKIQLSQINLSQHNNSQLNYDINTIISLYKEIKKELYNLNGNNTEYRVKNITDFELSTTGDIIVLHVVNYNNQDIDNLVLSNTFVNTLFPSGGAATAHSPILLLCNIGMYQKNITNKNNITSNYVFSEFTTKTKNEHSNYLSYIIKNLNDNDVTNQNDVSKLYLVWHGNNNIYINCQLIYVFLEVNFTKNYFTPYIFGISEDAYPALISNPNIKIKLSDYIDEKTETCIDLTTLTDVNDCFAACPIKFTTSLVPNNPEESLCMFAFLTAVNGNLSGINFAGYNKRLNDSPSSLSSDEILNTDDTDENSGEIHNILDYAKDVEGEFNSFDILDKNVVICEFNYESILQNRELLPNQITKRTYNINGDAGYIPTYSSTVGKLLLWATDLYSYKKNNIKSHNIELLGYSNNDLLDIINFHFDVNSIIEYIEKINFRIWERGTIPVSDENNNIYTINSPAFGELNFNKEALSDTNEFVWEINLSEESKNIICSSSTTSNVSEYSAIIYSKKYSSDFKPIYIKSLDNIGDQSNIFFSETASAECPIISDSELSIDIHKTKNIFEKQEQKKEKNKSGIPGISGIIVGLNTDSNSNALKLMVKLRRCLIGDAERSFYVPFVLPQQTLTCLVFKKITLEEFSNNHYMVPYRDFPFEHVIPLSGNRGGGNETFLPDIENSEEGNSLQITRDPNPLFIKDSDGKIRATENINASTTNNTNEKNWFSSLELSAFESFQDITPIKNDIVIFKYDEEFSYINGKYPVSLKTALINKILDKYELNQLNNSSNDAESMELSNTFMIEPDNLSELRNQDILIPLNSAVDTMLIRTFGEAGDENSTAQPVQINNIKSDWIKFTKKQVKQEFSIENNELKFVGTSHAYPPYDKGYQLSAFDDAVLQNYPDISLDELLNIKIKDNADIAVINNLSDEEKENLFNTLDTSDLPVSTLIKLYASTKSTNTSLYSYTITASDIKNANMLYVNYIHDSKSNSNTLVFNAQNLLNSPFISNEKLSDTSSDNSNILNNISLILDPVTKERNYPSAGLLNTCIQIVAVQNIDDDTDNEENTNTKIIGSKNILLGQYAIQNISDDKPKFNIGLKYLLDVNLLNAINKYEILLQGVAAVPLFGIPKYFKNSLNPDLVNIVLPLAINFQYNNIDIVDKFVFTGDLLLDYDIYNQTSDSPSNPLEKTNGNAVKDKISVSVLTNNTIGINNNETIVDNDETDYSSSSSSSSSSSYYATSSSESTDKDNYITYDEYNERIIKISTTQDIVYINLTLSKENVYNIYRNFKCPVLLKNMAITTYNKEDTEKYEIKYPIYTYFDLAKEI